MMLFLLTANQTALIVVSVMVMVQLMGLGRSRRVVALLKVMGMTLGKMKRCL